MAKPGLRTATNPIRSPLANTLSTHTTLSQRTQRNEGATIAPSLVLREKRTLLRGRARACRPRGQSGVSRGRARATVGPLATNPPDARVVLRPEIALRGLAATSPDLGVEGATTPLTHRRATLGPNAGVKLFTVLLARRRAATPRGLRARPRARLAAGRCHSRINLLVRSLRVLVSHIRHLLRAPPLPGGGAMLAPCVAQRTHRSCTPGRSPRPCPRVPPEA